MNLLPNYTIAIIEESKLVEYALNPENERGQHKARVFESALGFNLQNWKQLQNAILVGLENHEATLMSETPFGIKFRVVMTILGPNKRKANLLTVWQYDRQSDGETSDRPRLITLYLL
jgi:hypothetical protein